MGDVSHELEVKIVIGRWIARGVHQLHREIDAFGRRVGSLGRYDVPLAQDWGAALDQQTRALIVIGDDAVAEHHPLARLELDLETHLRLPQIALRINASGSPLTIV